MLAKMLLFAVCITAAGSIQRSRVSPLRYVLFMLLLSFFSRHALRRLPTCVRCWQFHTLRGFLTRICVKLLENKRVQKPSDSTGLRFVTLGPFYCAYCIYVALLWARWGGPDGIEA